MKHPLNPRTDDQRFKRPRSFWLNRCTSQLRSLPSFLIIGEMKSGTSSLFHYIQRHPMVAPPLRKEIHYFSIGSHKGLGWYRSHFPLRKSFGQDAITGEGCPDYLFAPGADQKIHRLIPEVKMIALLRDPVERAISHYYHEVRMGREYLPIMEALKAEEERLSDASIDDAEGLETYLHASYKRRGCYADQLARYFSVFGREQLLILGNNQLLRDPEKTTNEVFDFLSLPQMQGDLGYPKKNSGERKGIPAEVYAYLEEYFEPHNQRLFDMLGQTVDW